MNKNYFFQEAVLLTNLSKISLKFMNKVPFLLIFLMSSESAIDILVLTYHDVDKSYKRVSIENKHRKQMHTFGLQTLRASMIRGIEHGKFIF
ncbi:hypothetical protein PSR59_10525 [Ligilactobacillus ruminis]|uniref:Uncharacterized protein n=1 Tax=Ligilactobacillus ruminis TaxID=1623 RepID=A0AAQ3AT62_9LACO|nr:hypothetical protein [Ligilactobacillus ruminis]WDC82045.1 hypothetical protein PSR59_10525 [Ligilactobacillus ruminis]